MTNFGNLGEESSGYNIRKWQWVDGWHGRKAREDSKEM